ncbi:hypothetical protein ACFPZK_04155 [Psychrobacter urativorans]|uniref:hypothetical protein n=1 Tax=Psychrobacter urativorans TaxID=45610 RepID=UPI001919EEF7|nr:hypothetical protein [Psychrobacter urativorans]
MKNRLVLFIIGLCSLLFISACQTSPVIDHQNDSTSSSENLVKECLAKGGEYLKQGRLQMHRCVMQFSDEGKSCSDSSDCQGSCLSSKLDSEPGKPNQVGTCAANDSPFGCRQLIEGGITKGTLCID